MTRTEPKAVFTRRNLLGVLCFSVAFALAFLGVDAALHQEREYSGTWARIRREKAVPQVLILGNSHAFCSFVPEILNEMLGVDSALLAASGLNSVGATDSFEAALSAGTPQYIVVESNAYTFDYDATALYHKGTALSNINGMPCLIDRVKSAWREFGYESIPQGAFQLLRADLMWSRWKGGESETAPDGTSLLPWHATGVYDAALMQQEAQEYWQNAKAWTELDPRNEKQLRRLMDLAREHGVQVLLVKAPTEHQTQLGADILTRLDEICREYGGSYLGLHDFHTNVADMGLTVRDFYDNSHLSRSGAARLTRVFARWMGEKTGLPVQEDHVFAYGGEWYEWISDGVWRYGMDALGEGVEYRFELDGETVQDWGWENSVDLALDPAQAGRLTAYMRRGAEEISLAFMTPNTCIFN